MQSPVPAITRPQALADLLLALLLPTVGSYLAARATLLITERPPMPLLLLLQGVVILGGIHILLRWRGQDWRDLALHPLQPRDLWRGLLTLAGIFGFNLLVTLAIQWLSPEAVATHQERLADFSVTLTEGLRFGMVVLAMLFVGFYEEAFARGFLLVRSQALLGGIWGPVLLSSALFGLGHVYQGWIGVAQTLIVGIVFARLVLHWGTLWPAVLAHAALNTLSINLLRNVGSAGSGVG